VIVFRGAAHRDPDRLLGCERSMRAFGETLSRLDLARRAGDATTLGGLRHVVLDDGPGRGVRVVEVRTGSGLAFDVLVDRALDIGAATYGGRGFGWQSATGVRHPGLHENADEGGLGWLRSFTGLLVTGGLDHTGHAGPADASHFKYPFRKTTWNPLHGRIANTPATLIGAGEHWVGDRCTLWVEGEVRQAAIFAEHLRLRRRIEADLGEDDIRLFDTVTNVGFDRTPHVLLYHLNLGWPLLDAGSRFVAPIRRTLFCTPSVAEQRVSYQHMPPPLPGFVEQVYSHELVADSDGYVSAALVNERLELAVSVRWSPAQLPGFGEWLHLREGGYAMAIEPTSRVFGRHAEPDWLEPGDSRQYELRIRAHAGREALDAVVDGIEAVARQPEADVPDVAG
jgi:hypothetical protein